MKTALLLLAFALCTASAFGQAGALDPTFGVGGKFIPEQDAGNGENQMAIQADGKIVVAAADFSGKFQVYRYLPNGTKDETFGTNGRVITTFEANGQPADAFAKLVALQPDGKIVVAGGASGTIPGQDFAVARYHPDGSLDSTFSGDGRATMSLGNSEAYANALALHEGKIIVAGNYSGESGGQGFVHAALARFNEDGSPDSTFSQDGWLTESYDAIPGRLTTARDMVVQPDGKIILVGDYESTSGFGIVDFLLMRFNTDGSPDSTFSDDGKLRVDLHEGFDILEGVVLQPDGKIVAAGVGTIGFQLTLVRYLNDGSPDPAFGIGGIVSTSSLIISGSAFALVLQPDGKIVAAGSSGGMIDNVFYSDFMLARYDTNGALDRDFGNGGVVTTDFDRYDSYVFSIGLQADGKLLALGSANDDSGQFSALARYLLELSVGALDFSLAPSEVLVYPNPVGDAAILEYELPQNETITIQLLDLRGRVLHTFVQAAEQLAGPHQVTLRFPAALPAGAYVLCISNAQGRVSVRIVK